MLYLFDLSFLQLSVLVIKVVTKEIFLSQISNVRYDTCQQTTTSLMYSATTGDVTALRRLHGGGSDMGARYDTTKLVLELTISPGTMTGGLPCTWQRLRATNTVWSSWWTTAACPH